MNIEKFKKSILMTVALQVLVLVLCFLPMFNYFAASGSIAAFGEVLMNQTIEKTISFVACLEGTSEVLILFMLVYIAAIVCVAIPLIKDDLYKYQRFILSKISGFLTIAMWCYISLSMLDTPKDFEYLGLKCELTFSGWLILIATVAQIIMLFFLSYQSKVISDRKEVEAGASAYAQNDLAKQPIPTGGWRCSCGRPHAAFVSSCPCGVNKRELQEQVASDTSKNRS